MKFCFPLKSERSIHGSTISAADPLLPFSEFDSDISGIEVGRKARTGFALGVSGVNTVLDKCFQNRQEINPGGTAVRMYVHSHLLSVRHIILAEPKQATVSVGDGAHGCQKLVSSEDLFLTCLYK